MAIFASSHAPDALAGIGNSNSTNFEPNWYAGLNGLNNGIGDPSNNPVGYISAFDPINAGLSGATGSWNASHTPNSR